MPPWGYPFLLLEGCWREMWGLLVERENADPHSDRGAG